MALINQNMGEHFGHVDESKNPDLCDIQDSYRQGVFLVALGADDRVVGTGSLMPEGPGCGRVARMHTSTHHRRLGIARLILCRLEACAKARGFHSVVLETNVDWHDAIAFYSASGYQETNRDEFEIHFVKSLE